MTWLVALAYVAAAASLLASLRMLEDPRVRAALGPGPPPGRRPRALERIGSRWRLPAARRRVEERLGGGDAARVDRVIGAKVVLGAAGVALGASAAPSGPGPAVAAAVALGLGGFVLPDYLLARGLERARSGMGAALVDLLDLVSMAVSAGLTPRLALDRASEWVRGPLGEELRRARAEVTLGARWRDALRDVADRRDLRDLRRLAVTLDRASRLGTPVDERLRSLAREVRSERLASQEERARRAPVLMLFPLVFLILPAFVIASVVPAVLVATRGLV